jgi:hypothetical protein
MLTFQVAGILLPRDFLDALVVVRTRRSLLYLDTTCKPKDAGIVEPNLSKQTKCEVACGVLSGSTCGFHLLKTVSCSFVLKPYMGKVHRAHRSPCKESKITVLDEAPTSLLVEARRFLLYIGTIFKLKKAGIGEPDSC